MELDKKELLSIAGGISITGTFINAIAKGINAILDLGRSLGTAIRRTSANNLCPLK